MTDDDEPRAASGYRSYEVYQRERVAESSNLLTARELIGDEMLTDPYRLLTILREHHPCYRDWVGNRFWITRYDDVTSVFTDDANYSARPRRWFAGHADLGRDLRAELLVEAAITERTDASVEAVVLRVLDGLRAEPDLGSGFAGRLPIELWGEVLGLPRAELARFAVGYWRLQRGLGSDPIARLDASRSAADLASLFEPMLSARRVDPGDDLISVVAQLEFDDGPATAADLVATLWESDHETLHGGLANMWFQLLTRPDQFAAVRDDRRLVKFAWLETLRHSPPVHATARFARHEVERFGRLLPEGALMWCSAAAANRDPRVFADPDDFDVTRADLCRREPRGQYRADGLPSGISFGTGPPSIHPAVPKERPRSAYALTRDTAVTASQMLLDAYGKLRLADGADPILRSLRLGEMYTCWSLRVDC
jgi:pulcherriminic acid synthase